MNINNKGFTLVEIIVTIGILGVITLIAFPAILALQSSNEDTKYESYMNSLGSNARVYVNSFEKDIFPNKEENSCFILDYETMYNNELIKDIDIDGVSCSNSDFSNIKTFVQVNLDDGKYSYFPSLYCYNDQGMVVDKSFDYKSDGCKIIDDEAPKIEIISDTDVVDKSKIKPSNYKKNHDLTIRVSDKSGLGEGIVIEYGWGYNGEMPTSYTTYSFNNNYGVNEVELSLDTDSVFGENVANGNMTLHVKAVNVADTEGWKDSKSATSYFPLDNMAPSVPNIEKTHNGLWRNYDYTLDVTSSDNLSGISYYQYSYDDKNWTTYKSSAGNSYETTPFSKERNQNVYIRACDYAGNCSGSGVSNIKIDKTKPSIPILNNPNNNKWVNYYYSITVSSNDNLSSVSSGIAYYKYKYEGEGWNTYSNSNINSFTTTLFNKNVDKNVEIVSCDYAGNCSNSASTKIKIDTTPPDVPSVINPYHNKWAISPYKVTLKSYDGGSGISSYQYKYASTDWKAYSNSSLVNSFVTTNFSINRNEYVYFRVCDKVGNCSSSSNSIIKLDTIKPSCSTTGFDENWRTTGLTLTGNCSDGGSGCVGNVSKYFSNGKGNYSPGSVRDHAGNVTVCEAKPVYVDTKGLKAPAFNSVVSIKNYINNPSINYDDCIGKGGGYEDASCTVKFDVFSSSGISFQLNRDTVNEDWDNGFGYSHEVNIWTHSYPNSSIGYCDQWFREGEKCNDWQHGICKTPTNCPSEQYPKAGRHCVANVDTQGRVGYSLCVNYEYTWK